MIGDIDKAIVALQIVGCTHLGPLHVEVYTFIPYNNGTSTIVLEGLMSRGLHYSALCDQLLLHWTSLPPSGRAGEASAYHPAYAVNDRYS